MARARAAPSLRRAEQIAVAKEIAHQCLYRPNLLLNRHFREGSDLGSVRRDDGALGRTGCADQRGHPGRPPDSRWDSRALPESGLTPPPALRAAGLVDSRRDGRMILYALTATGRALLETALAHRAKGGPVSTAARELRVITLGGTVRSLESHAASVALRPLVRVASSLGGSERRRGRGQAGHSP